jgi:hypothetical protein
VTYDDAPIGLLKDAGDATRFACDIARMQAQIGRVTWVIVLAEVEEFTASRRGLIPTDRERPPSGERAVFQIFRQKLSESRNRE